VGLEYVPIALSFGIATAIIGRAKGSSFFIWLLIGTILPLIGLVAAVLHRSEKVEPERPCVVDTGSDSSVVEIAQDQ